MTFDPHKSGKPHTRVCDGAVTIAVACFLLLTTVVRAGIIPLTPPHATLSGSLGTSQFTAMLQGGGRFAIIEIPPHHLVVSWTNLVTITGQEIEWDGAEVCAAHYGLESWDEALRRYVLVYEEKANSKIISAHRFTPVTTRRIRFSVFVHPLQYYSLIIRRFTLFSPEDTQP